MDSRYLLNEALDDPTKLQTPQNPLEHLVHSLKVLTKGFPPRKDTYTTNECHGLYSGPTSIAYLFLCISRTHPDLVISGRKPSQWASEYLQGSRDCHAASASKSGVINERLAYGAVRAAVTQDLKDVEKLAEDVNKAALTSERGSDEWLYGRAGCLYLLRLARSWVPNSDRIVDPVIHKVIKKMLAHGPAWPWHGKDYLGAVHGRIGIITQIILSNPSMASEPTLLQNLDSCLNLQTKDGNWPSSTESGRSHLVQFCHGAPGFVISFKAIRQYLPSELQESIGIASKLAEKCILEQGLLRKEPNLCHGISGNALALPSPYKEHFVAYTAADIVKEGVKKGLFVQGDDPYGLFCGEAGRAWGWYTLVAGGDKGMIGYSDV